MRNKILKKIVCVGLLSASLLGFNSLSVKAETVQTTQYYNQWVQVNGQWEYYNTFGQLLKDCWVKDANNRYYYLDSNGIMLTNKWIEFEGKNYYVGADGVWVLSNVLKTTGNTYIKNKQIDTKATEEKETNSDVEDKEDDYDYLSYHKKKVKDNTNTNNSANKTTSESSNSNSTSSTSDDYYDYSSKGSNETWVSGYYRKGKYVSGHYRTKKDSTTSNNYSHKGNTNPHSGKKGYSKK